MTIVGRRFNAREECMATVRLEHEVLRRHLHWGHDRHSIMESFGMTERRA